MSKLSHLEAVPCSLCGNLDTEPLLAKGQFGLPCHVAICPNDGLVYLNPRWTAERYHPFYATEYDTYYHRLTSSPAPSGRDVACASEIWRRVRDHVPAPCRAVLDIGAGSGATLAYLRQQLGSTVRLAAVEPSEACRQVLSTQIGAEVLGSAAEDDWFSQCEAPFDLVVMRHTLEHLLDPVAVLSTAARSIADNGMVYVNVPDMMCPRRSPRHSWFRVVHTYYYSQETLAYTAALAGLEPLTVRCENNGIWGVFVNASPGYCAAKPNVYKEQRDVIEGYLAQWHFRDMLVSCASILAHVVPRGLGKYVPNKVKRFLGR